MNSALVLGSVAILLNRLGSWIAWLYGPNHSLISQPVLRFVLCLGIIQIADSSMPLCQRLSTSTRSMG